VDVLLLVGFLLWFLGEFTWSFYSLYLGIEIPYLSMADVFWLAAYPFALIGMVAFVYPFRAAISRRNMLPFGLRRFSSGHSLEDKRRVFDTVLTERGWGRCLDFKEQNPPPGTVYTITMSGCLLCHDRKSSKPLCHMLRGVVAGSLEAYLNKKVKETKEIQCAAVSGELCIFQITFV